MQDKSLPRPVAVSRSPERLALLVVVLVHGLLLGWWAFQQKPMVPEITLMSVRMLSPAPVAPSVQPRADSTPPRQTPAPAPMPVAKPAAEAPSPVSEPVPATPVAAAPAPAEATLPPRFDADYLDNPSPRYPPLSRKLAEQGKVLLRVMVTPSGRAQRVQVEQGSGYARLDEAAVVAVSDWRFVPARQGSQTVPAQVLVPIVFSLTR